MANAPQRPAIFDDSHLSALVNPLPSEDFFRGTLRIDEANLSLSVGLVTKNDTAFLFTRRISGSLSKQRDMLEDSGIRIEGTGATNTSLQMPNGGYSVGMAPFTAISHIHPGHRDRSFPEKLRCYREDNALRACFCTIEGACPAFLSDCLIPAILPQDEPGPRVYDKKLLFE